MTAVAGLVHEGRVHICGDSAASGGTSIMIRADRKVFTHPQRAPGQPEQPDHWAFGYTTSYRMGQILQHAFTPPVLPEDTDLHRFMCTTFVDALRAAFKTAGWARDRSGIEETGQFLIGVRGRLFIVDEDYQVGEPADGYAAVGCGTDLALGSLHTTRSLGWTPNARLRSALMAAAHHSTGVQAPFVYVTTGGEGPHPGEEDPTP